MVTLNLDRIFKPKSVAIIGASKEEGTVRGTLSLREEEQQLPCPEAKAQEEAQTPQPKESEAVSSSMQIGQKERKLTETPA